MDNLKIFFLYFLCQTPSKGLKPRVWILSEFYKIRIRIRADFLDLGLLTPTVWKQKEALKIIQSIHSIEFKNFRSFEVQSPGSEIPLYTELLVHHYPRLLIITINNYYDYLPFVKYKSTNLLVERVQKTNDPCLEHGTYIRWSARMEWFILYSYILNS